MLQVQNGPVIAAGGAAGGTTVLPITYLTQYPYENLCWAACCAMVLNADRRPNGTVTEVAALVTRQPCSSDPETSRCNRSLNDLGDSWRTLNIQYSVPQPQQSSVDLASVVDQIVNGRRPLELFWRYRDDASTGHVVLVVGYDPASQTFCLFDPLEKPNWYDYGYLKTKHNTADWIETYYALGDYHG